MSDEKPSGKRTVAIAAVTAGTLAVVGVGAFAAVQFLSGGPQAEQALPASSIAVVSLDLDPGAKQKVEALKTLRKFPELRKQLKIGSGEDLRKKFFDEALKQGDCKKLSYDSDIRPWIGDNVALAAVPFTKSKVSPVAALAITDQDRAARGLDALIGCSSSAKDTAYALNGDFVVISDTQAHADQVVKDAKASPLTDDTAYREWTDKVGDRGVANFYVAKAAAGFLTNQLGSLSSLGPDDFPSGSASSSTDLPSGFPTELTPGAEGAGAPYARQVKQGDSTDTIRKALANFKGAAGALRFADVGAELEMVGGGLSLVSGQHSDDLVTGLPGDTAAALGLALPRGWGAKLTENLDSFKVPGFGFGSDFRSRIEDQLGISLPDDLETLLGQGVALSVRGTPPADLSRVRGPQDAPVGLTVKGDADKIKAVLAKIEAKQGKTLADSGITLEDGNGKVSLSFDGDYAKALEAKGDLGGNATFKKVVPDAAKASAVFYVDFNSKWRQVIAKQMSSGTTSGSDSFLGNTEPLEAFGLSSWSDGDTSHLLVKLTTD